MSLISPGALYLCLPKLWNTSDKNLGSGVLYNVAWIKEEPGNVSEDIHLGPVIYFAKSLNGKSKR